MTSIKSAISIEETLYQQISTLAAQMNIPRSKLFALAAEEYLRLRGDRQLLQSINEAYAEDLDESEQAMLEGMRLHQRQLREQE